MERTMNIFFLHDHPTTCAAWHCDKHVVKMVLESAQLLCTAHHELDGDRVQFKDLYKSAYKNHPCAVWARSGSGNYIWLHKLLDELCFQYTLRYKKVHKVEMSGLLSKLSALPKNIEHSKFYEPPQCMPEQYKVVSPSSRAIPPTQEAYIDYYLGEKRSFAKWQFTKTPAWFDIYED